MKKINITLDVMKKEVEVEILVPGEFENWGDFEQMKYIEEELIDNIFYTWDYEEE